jgi:hypothetical protein
MADVLELDNAEEFDEEHISKLKEKAKRYMRYTFSVDPLLFCFIKFASRRYFVLFILLHLSVLVPVRRKGRGFDGSGMEREEGDYDRIDEAEEGNPGPQRSIEVANWLG